MEWSDAESASYEFAINEARRLKNRKALKELSASGPPPYSARSLLKERTWLQWFEGQLRPNALWKMIRIFLGGPEPSILDLADILKGFQFSFNAMWNEVSSINLLNNHHQNILSKTRPENTVHVLLCDYRFDIV